MFKVTTHEESFASWLQVIGLLFGAIGVMLPVLVVVLTPPGTMTIGALTTCAFIFVFCVFAAISFFVFSHFADVLYHAVRRPAREGQETARAPEQARKTEVKTEPRKMLNSSPASNQPQPPTGTAREMSTPQTPADSPHQLPLQPPDVGRKEAATPVTIQPSSKVMPLQKKTASPVLAVHAKVKGAKEEAESAPPQAEPMSGSPLAVLEISSAEDILSSDMTPLAAPAAASPPASQAVDTRGRAEVESMFESIKTFIDMEMWHLAYQRANELIKKHPESPEAARLKKNLDTFHKKAEEMLVAW